MGTPVQAAMGLYVTDFQTHKSRAMRGFLVWWAHTDLNRGPKDYELLGELLCLEKVFVGERSLA